MSVDVDKPVIPHTTLPSAASASQNVPASLRTFDLRGPAGRLEALLNEGRSDAPYVTLICHPHPLGGGTMHNKVVYHAMKVFHGQGWPVLRFNFRGTGLSEGSHDGRAEVDDVRTALDWLHQEFGKPIVAAGFSFGAAMGLKACCTSTDHAYQIHGFAALGLPTHAEGRDYTYRFLQGCKFPKLFLSGDHDQYAPASQLHSIVDSASQPKQLALIQGADHFFVGQLAAMQATLSQWLRSTFPNTTERPE
jgi:alpha/beta superfamily hydrolase